MAKKQGSSGAHVKAAASSQQVVKCSRIASLSLSAPHGPWAGEQTTDLYLPYLRATPPFDPDLLGMVLLIEWTDRMLKLGYSHQFCTVHPPFMVFSEKLIVPLRR